LSVGQQVGEHFFFRVRQGFGDAQATELILEYQLEDHLRVQAAAAQTPSAQRVTFRRVERAGLDLIFFFSYLLSSERQPPPLTTKASFRVLRGSTPQAQFRSARARR